MVPINSAQALTAIAKAASEASPATSAKSKPVESAEEKKLRKAAGDFESMLLSSMWKSMKKSFGDSGESDSDPANGTIEDWGIEAMSEAVGKSGGLGIGNLIIKHLAPVAEADQQNQKTHAMTTILGTNVLGKLADKTGKE